MLPPSAYRLPFIVANTIMSHIATRPPNNTPSNEERKQYDENKHPELLSAVLSWYLPTFWLVMHGMNLAEFYVTLATSFPAISSPALLSVLSNTDNTLAPLSYRLHVTPLFITGTFLSCFGGLLRLACYRHLGRHFTFELALRKEHKLITDGPYGFVRHPSYLGSVACFGGILACQFGSGSWWTEGELWSTAIGRVVGTWWLVYVAFLLVSMVVIRVPKEDKVLKDAFGKQWQEWSKGTPYRIFPGIY
ncbi:hypothetical protein EUX98_g3619 [Antrodiella citrinella]|uniref:Protein-S-isoprenylcysteine O-methyltransferase n=1 Tax=Antrodiella citrinella TaxID=2447956 RepID=A0A4S4MYT8_9APHY|nr:hypothetical protein EUX98_g3619 [Antrodiella citrinella]